MKKIALILICAVLFLVACNNDATNTERTDSTVIERDNTTNRDTTMTRTDTMMKRDSVK